MEKGFVFAEIRRNIKNLGILLGIVLILAIAEGVYDYNSGVLSVSYITNSFMFSPIVLFLSVTILPIWSMYLMFKIIWYSKNPKKHPTYKQLWKHGNEEELIQEIDGEVTALGLPPSWKKIRTKTWEIEKGAFKTKIEKNDLEPSDSYKKNLS